MLTQNISDSNFNHSLSFSLTQSISRQKSQRRDSNRRIFDSFMNFFRSILSDESDLPPQDNPKPESPTNSSQQHHDDEADRDGDSDSDQSSEHHESEAESGGGWSFGGLIQTLATRSESVIETYRRDLKEFGSGLQKETATFREVASRAVKDLPASIEVAQGSLETVLKSTAEIISHGKETLLAPSDGESDPETLNPTNQRLSSQKYSRFDAQLRAIQSDSNTYCEEPEDLDDFNKWKLGFVLEDKSGEVETLIEENGSMEEIYKRVVPNLVDRKTFWCRYFYRVYKLRQQEDVRASLVKRAISIEDDEELTWDVEDDEDDDKKEINGVSKVDIVTAESKEFDHNETVKDDSDEAEVGSSKVVYDKGENRINVDNVDRGNVTEASSGPLEEISEVNNAETVLKSDEKVGLEGKVENGESLKDSDVLVVSAQQASPKEEKEEEEEDLGWDEIEDIEDNEEKKVAAHSGSPNREDLRKRLSAADEEDEDLSWDIEDDDEPVKNTGIK